VSEAECPFCKGALSDTLRALPAPRAPVRRLKRAALYAIGASGVVLGACSTSSGSNTMALYGGPPADAAMDGNGSDSGQVIALYGAPPADAGMGLPTDASPDVPTVMALYGGPPQDAAADVPMGIALYGGAPSDSGGSG
jgi:hypothetical protein